MKTTALALVFALSICPASEASTAKGICRDLSGEAQKTADAVREFDFLVRSLSQGSPAQPIGGDEEAALRSLYGAAGEALPHIKKLREAAEDFSYALQRCQR